MTKTTSRWLGVVCMTVAAAILLWVGVRRADRTSMPEGATREVPRDERSLVVITIDTTRADRLTPYGADNVETPAMQRLADEGVLFERAYAVAPITLVAHTSMMTGLYPFDHGVRNNGIQRVPGDVSTLAEVLRERGYRTGAFVSAAVLERQYGLDQGFEVYDDDLSTGRDRRPRVVADRPAEAVFASAEAWLDGLDPDENFFLWVHLYDPHAVYSPPPPYRDTYRDRLYEGEIAYMDAQIGRFLAHPRVARDRDDAPILTVIGDHGESLGEHGERTHAILAYDSTLHIPWILDIPGGPEGLRVPYDVSQVDLLPTLLDLLDQDVPEGVDGTSLRPQIAGAPPQPRGLYSETYLPYYTYGWAKLRVLRSGIWKYVQAPTPELYRLDQDPRELSNVHDGQPGPAHDLSRDLDEMLAEVEDADKEASMELDAESMEQLRSLGYLSVGSPADYEGERPDPKDVIDVHVLLERARFLLQDRFFEQAESAVRQLLDRDPRNLAGLVELITALEGQGRLDDAVRTAERVLELDPNYARGYQVLSRLEAARGNLDQAVELSRLALEKDEQNPDFLIHHAGQLQKAGRRLEAVEVLERAVALHPEHPRVATAYARSVEIPGGRPEAAEDRLRAAVERDPFLAGAWSVLGRLLEDAGRLDEALAAYREGLQRTPDDAALHQNLGNLLARRGGLAEAEQHLREAIRLTPRFDPNLHVSLGGVLAESGRFEEARRIYERVLDGHPKHPGALNNSAIALYRQGRLDEARDVLLGLVETHPNHADAHNNLSGIAVDQENWKQAELHARRSLELAPDLVQAHNNLAIALEEQGRLDEAEREYRRTLELDGEYWPALVNLGILLAKAQRPADAAEALGQALTLAPNQPVAHLELGKLYQGPLDDADEALKHFNAFLGQAPKGDPRAEEVRRRIADLAVAAKRP